MSRLFGAQRDFCSVWPYGCRGRIGLWAAEMQFVFEGVEDETEEGRLAFNPGPQAHGLVNPQVAVDVGWPAPPAPTPEQ